MFYSLACIYAKTNYGLILLFSISHIVLVKFILFETVFGSNFVRREIMQVTFLVDTPCNHFVAIHWNEKLPPLKCNAFCIFYPNLHDSVVSSQDDLISLLNSNYNDKCKPHKNSLYLFCKKQPCSGTQSLVPVRSKFHKGRVTAKTCITRSMIY